MQNVSIHKAAQLPQEVKSAVEQLLGRPIDGDEEISVVAVPRQQVPPSDDRATLARKLETFLNRREEKLKELPCEDIEAAIDESLRRNRQSRT